MADSNHDPIVLEVAALPREQIGPFLILGVDKDATNAEIEAHWAQRLIWARAKQIRVPLEDVNWAKEILLDREKRILTWFRRCQECGARLSDVSRLAYEPRFVPDGNDRFLTLEDPTSRAPAKARVPLSR